VVKQVEAIRTRMTDGVTEAADHTTLGVLRRMAENLATAGTLRGAAGARMLPQKGV
jgi:hypothetical protein